MGWINTVVASFSCWKGKRSIHREESQRLKSFLIKEEVRLCSGKEDTEMKRQKIKRKRMKYCINKRCAFIYLILKFEHKTLKLYILQLL
jgi:hypothetical protein